MLHYSTWNTSFIRSVVYLVAHCIVNSSSVSNPPSHMKLYILSDTYLLFQELPRNIGYLKKLSTLIIDENDLTYIPPQVSVCVL